MCPPSNHFLNVYQQLPHDIQDHFERWCQNIIQTQGGFDIVYNIRSEHHLNQDFFAEFITEITRSYNNETEARPAYEQACRNFHNSRGSGIFCLGAVSDVEFDTVLYRIVKLKYLKKMISEAMGNNGSRRDNPEEAWDDFRNYMQTDDPNLREILNGVCPGRSDLLIWAYHPSDQAKPNDPLGALTADDHLDQLGLAPEWGYERGLTEHQDNSPWKIRYSPSSQIRRYIPTIADTLPHWNPYFQPTQDLESPKYGWTRPIGDGRGIQGVPETVHLGWEQGEEPGCVQHIEFLRA